MAEFKSKLTFVGLFLSVLNIILIILSIALSKWYIHEVRIHDVKATVEEGLWKRCGVGWCVTLSDVEGNVISYLLFHRYQCVKCISLLVNIIEQYLVKTDKNCYCKML